MSVRFTGASAGQFQAERSEVVNVRQNVPRSYMSDKMLRGRTCQTKHSEVLHVRQKSKRSYLSGRTFRGRGDVIGQFDVRAKNYYQP